MLFYHIQFSKNRRGFEEMGSCPSIEDKPNHKC